MKRIFDFKKRCDTKGIRADLLSSETLDTATAALADLKADETIPLSIKEKLLEPALCSIIDYIKVVDKKQLNVIIWELYKHPTSRADILKMFAERGIDEATFKEIFCPTITS